MWRAQNGEPQSKEGLLVYSRYLSGPVRACAHDPNPCYDIDHIYKYLWIQGQIQITDYQLIAVVMHNS